MKLSEFETECQKDYTLQDWIWHALIRIEEYRKAQRNLVPPPVETLDARAVRMNAMHDRVMDHLEFYIVSALKQLGERVDPT
jgi:hypothetical protein